MGRQTSQKRALLGTEGWSRQDTITAVAVISLILLLSYFVPFPLPRSRSTKNQASAAGNLRTINTSESTYADTYKAGFSPTLAVLGPPPGNAQPSASAAGFIDSVLAGGLKSGYRITYTPGSPDKTGHVKTYTVTAQPLKYGETGRNSYFTDESGVIRMTEDNRPATAKDPPVGG